MKQRPWEIWILVGFYAGTAISLPLQVMVQYGHAPWEISAIATKLAPLNWVIFGLAVACAWSAYAASRALVVFAPIFLAAVAWNNWLFTEVDANLTGLTTSAATLLAFLSQIPLLRPRPLSLLQEPGRRWWLTAPRRKLKLLSLLSPVTGGDLRARAFDVSATGAFFAIEDARWAMPTGNGHGTAVGLAPGTRCNLRMTLDQGRTIQCAAQVVRNTRGTGNYPTGFAVKFLDLASGDRRALENLLQTRGEAYAA
jgi:hypothetical protein